MMHVAALKALLRLAEMTMHSSQAAKIAALKQDKASNKVLPQYADYVDVFSFNLAIDLPENTGIN